MVDSFLLAFGVIFLAELGDKSQLMALAFAARYRPWIVLLAVAIGSFGLFGGSVIVGRVVGLALPANVISIAGGIVFLAFAAWTVRDRDDGQGGAERSASSIAGPLVTVVSAFVIAELGDKTMIATITLATTHEAIGTWLGAVGGEVTADAIAILIGAFLGTRLPERAIKIFAAGTFLVFGLILIGEGVGIL